MAGRFWLRAFPWLGVCVWQLPSARGCSGGWERGWGGSDESRHISQSLPSLEKRQLQADTHTHRQTQGGRGCALPSTGPRLCAHLELVPGSSRDRDRDRDAPDIHRAPAGPEMLNELLRNAQTDLFFFSPHCLFFSQLENVALLHYKVGGAFYGRFLCAQGAAPGRWEVTAGGTARAVGQPETLLWHQQVYISFGNQTGNFCQLRGRPSSPQVPTALHSVFLI